jgi:hypothetical protein
MTTTFTATVRAINKMPSFNAIKEIASSKIIAWESFIAV